MIEDLLRRVAAHEGCGVDSTVAIPAASESRAPGESPLPAIDVDERVISAGGLPSFDVLRACVRELGQRASALGAFFHHMRPPWTLCDTPAIWVRLRLEDLTDRRASEAKWLETAGGMPREHFPVGTLDDDRVADSFQAIRFSRLLRVLDEPPLSSLSTPADHDAYRFLLARILPGFGPAVVRVELGRFDGMVRWKMADGKGGHHGDPGRLALDQRRELEPADRERFLQVVRDTSFWDLRAQRPFFRGDGSMWVIEGLSSRRYRVVVRQYGQELVPLGGEFKRLTGAPFGPS